MKGQSAPERLMDKVAIAGACWEWMGSRTPDGYGTFWFEGRPRRAHRVSYEMFIGPIPEELQLDHLCRVRHCVNPWHLDPVSSRENTLRSELAAAGRHARQTHCKHGHPITHPSQFYVRVGGARSCRACQLRRTRQYRAKKAAKSS